MYDIIIIGAGPAGMTAALYARRAEKSVLLIEKETFGGQITYSPKVENYPGFLQMSGNEFADKLLEQVTALETDIEMEEVLSVKKQGDTLLVTTDRGEHEAKAVIVAAGSRHRHLGVDREEDFIGEGVSYCAVCDGAFYKGRDVAVIGGGNTALQEAVLLADQCRKVTILQNLPDLTGEEKLRKKLRTMSNVEILCSVTVDALLGENDLTGVRVKDANSGETSDIAVDGIFVAIGHEPENAPFAEVTVLNDQGYIQSGEDCLTDTPGVFVAGDCRTKAVRQITTATGDGAVAALAACRYLDSLS